VHDSDGQHYHQRPVTSRKMSGPWDPRSADTGSSISQLPMRPLCGKPWPTSCTAIGRILF
jgi:hypothetical protein